MTEYDNTNTGIISRNQDKIDATAKGESHPGWSDQKGSANVEGVEYWINGWIKERKDGSGKFLSLSFKRKEQSNKAPPAPPQDDFDDDIPF